MDVAEQEAFVHCFNGIHHVVRMAGERIERHHGDHAANLKIRVDVMAKFHHFSAGHELMMQHLIHRLFRIFLLGKYHAGAAITEQRIFPVTLVIDLVEGHPVFHFAFVTLHHHLAETHKEIDDLTVFPAAVFLHQMPRHFEVGEGDYRLNIVFEQLIKHIVIKLQTGFVWL
ncbi:hypothetical protein SRABI106_04440 [Rahnella aquatilis]|nr:hypothetical protein SRABI106_04440 [Rahnella aquatilis]